MMGGWEKRPMSGRYLFQFLTRLVKLRPLQVKWISIICPVPVQLSLNWCPLFFVNVKAWKRELKLQMINRHTSVAEVRGQRNLTVSLKVERNLNPTASVIWFPARFSRTMIIKYKLKNHWLSYLNVIDVVLSRFHAEGRSKVRELKCSIAFRPLRNVIFSINPTSTFTACDVSLAWGSHWLYICSSIPLPRMLIFRLNRKHYFINPSMGVYLGLGWFPGCK